MNGLISPPDTFELPEKLAEVRLSIQRYQALRELVERKGIADLDSADAVGLVINDLLSRLSALGNPLLPAFVKSLHAEAIVSALLIYRSSFHQLMMMKEV